MTISIGHATWTGKPTLPLSAAASGIVPAYSCVNAPSVVSYSITRFCSNRTLSHSWRYALLTYEDELHNRGEVALEIRFDVARVERGGDDTLIAVPPCQL